MNRFDSMKKIRQQYANVIDEWMGDYEKTGRMCNDPYVFDCVDYMTPIEDSVWSDIRSEGVPFYPQVPVLNYFLDFGCPMLRIGIECDGKQWHDAEKDAARDRRLAIAGWTIFRLPGHECMRTLPLPYERKEQVDPIDATAWFMTTSQGFIHALNASVFKEEKTEFDEKNWHLIERTLCAHYSDPVAQKSKKSI